VIERLQLLSKSVRLEKLMRRLDRSAAKREISRLNKILTYVNDGDCVVCALGYL
jgi:hypothetical protein